MNHPRRIADIDIDQYTKASLQLHEALLARANPEEVFQVLANHTAMPEWFPGMTAARIDVNDTKVVGGTGTVRRCAFGEQEMTEDIILFEAPRLLAYTIRDGSFMGLRHHFALITITSHQDGSLIDWYQFFDHPNIEAFKDQGQTMLTGALDNLQKILE